MCEAALEALVRHLKMFTLLQGIRHATFDGDFRQSLRRGEKSLLLGAGKKRARPAQHLRDRKKDIQWYSEVIRLVPKRLITWDLSGRFLPNSARDVE